MVNPVLLLILFTMIPALELRFSIPYGFFGAAGQPVASLATVVLVCLVANMVLGLLVFTLMGPVVAVMRRWPWFERRIWPHLDRTQHRIRPYVEKYGELGVALFIGVPLPGSGVYTGAFGSYLLGLDRRRFAMANVFGVLIAGTAVTSLCLLLQAGAMGRDSWIARLFLKGPPPVEAPALPGAPTGDAGGGEAVPEAASVSHPEGRSL